MGSEMCIRDSYFAGARVMQQDGPELNDALAPQVVVGVDFFRPVSSNWRLRSSVRGAWLMADDPYGDVTVTFGLERQFSMSRRRRGTAAILPIRRMSVESAGIYTNPQVPAAQSPPDADRDADGVADGADHCEGSWQSLSVDAF